MKDSLINKGLMEIGTDDSRSARGLVVVGTARGGTSMVAGALNHLGVFMGDRAAAPVFEDTRLSDAFEASNISEVSRIVEEYSSQHLVWGWNRPSSINYLDDVYEHLDNPYFIFIFKDIFSIGNRNSISMQANPLDEMEKACNQYLKIIEFIKLRKPRALLVSYDKALNDVEGFVNYLIRFSGSNPSEKQIKSAIDFIQPNPDQYLDMSRINKSQGFVDLCDSGRVKGWAKYLYKKEPATVEVLVNDVFCGAIEASRPRPDLKEKLNMDCAFEYQFEEPLKPGDIVRVKVANDIYDLKNSSWVVN
jgi:hypothetical protein